MSNTVVKVENVAKEYKLGTIGGGTLRGDLQSFMARIRGKEDPNTALGTDTSNLKGKRFMALDGVSFEVKQGDTLGIIGANGAGKSTMLKLLSRVTAPSKGTISINGRIASMLEVGTGFHPELTGRENIFLNGAILGMTKAEVARKLDEIIAFAEMEQFIDTPVKRYSSGMYVKLAFSVAAHLDSEILILDEVLAVGDMKFQQKCLGKMGDVAENSGKTVLYVSHNMNTIRSLCNRCIVLNKGHKIFDGKVDEAIGIYMGERFNALTYYDMSNAKREAIQLGKNFKLQSVELLGKENAVYTTDEKMHIRFGYTLIKDTDDVRFNLNTFYLDSTPIGVSFSSKTPLKATSETKFIDFDFSLHMFPEGKYSAAVLISSYNPVADILYDQPLMNISFEVINGENDFTNWDHNFRGHVKLPTLERTSEK